MKKIYFLTTALLFLVIFSASSQSKNVEFKFVEQGVNDKTVVFTVLGIDDKDHQERLVNLMNNADGVLSFKIFYSRRCKAVLTNDCTADQIRDILRTESLDFDFDYVKINSKSALRELRDIKQAYPVEKTTFKGTGIYPADFPKYNDTGNPELDKQNLYDAKQQWMENNPEKYKEVTGREYLDWSKRYVK